MHLPLDPVPTQTAKLGSAPSLKSQTETERLHRRSKTVTSITLIDLVVLDHPLMSHPGMLLVSDQLPTTVTMLALGAMDLVPQAPRLLASGSITLLLGMLLQVALILCMRLVRQLLFQRNTPVLRPGLQHGLGSLLWAWL